MQCDKYFKRVVPRDQDFENDSYNGMFHFRFWLYGEWYDVVVDDILPFKLDGTLYFCSNKQQPNELWGPLLEKAYAKYFNSSIQFSNTILQNKIKGFTDHMRHLIRESLLMLY
jgi:hypothetical protein